MKKPTFLNAILTTTFFTGLALMMTQCVNTAEENAADTSSEETVAEAPVHKAQDPLERGEELYLSYCQICHGEQGVAGPMADLLKVTPPDLTKIAARRNGEYPEGLIFDIVKGNKELKGHGTTMPVWGETFRESENLKSDAEVDAEIRKVVAYLKTLQEG
ncbi:MAG: cytochrome c [Phaeodactylibacter sp.]|uniref:c-type cytochrome n=1 Tax=Phaeodactylibacter sp. TaxID=1940289 RepID=UPI0032EE6C67